VTKEMATKAKAELRAMRRSLKGWLSSRRKNDLIAAGHAAEIPTPLFKRPGTRPPLAPTPPERLAAQRYEYEQPLAEELHVLLSEVFDASQLPDPDLSKDPDAAVKLAQIAISGALPGEAVAEGATGLIWLWPAAIMVGAVMYTISVSVRSKADVAKHKADKECVMSGKCTDVGFWLKMASIAVIGWIAWDKLGVREKVQEFTGAKKKRRRKR
jgi:hypothetical protein